jgi:hypothetical protein
MAQGETPRRWWLVGGSAAVVVVLIAAGALFQPWRLFLDVEVREADPFASAAPSAEVPDADVGGTEPGGSGADDPRVLATGRFLSLAHPAEGTVRLGTDVDGRPVLFLADLQTDNGPDLKLYLSREVATEGDGELGADPLLLGDLKGNVGDQVYDVPGDAAELGSYRSVVIWCERFAVGFGVAPLD